MAQMLAARSGASRPLTAADLGDLCDLIAGTAAR